MATINSRLGRGLTLVIVFVVLMAGLPGISRIAAQPPGPLEGSFSGALALRRVDPADATRQSGQALLLTADNAAGDLAPFMASDQKLHILGWLEGGLLVLRATDDGLLAAVVYDPASDSETVLASDLPAELRYAFVAETDTTAARVVAWETGAQTPLAVVQVWAAADFQRLATYDVSAAGLMAARLAGVADDQAYFYSGQPTDAMLTLFLSTGAVDGPVEVLATGDGAGQVLYATVQPGLPLALAGRINPKDTPDAFTIPVAGGVLNAGAAQTHPVPDAAQRIAWRPDGAGAAVVTAIPGDFSGSNVLLTGADFATFSPPQRVAFDSCVAFTPDSRWLLFVSPDGTSLLAASVTDPNASTRVLLRGEPALDLCEAAWQPAAPGTATPVATELQPGTVISGEITDDAYGVDVPLPLAANDTVTITMEATGGDLDAFLLLLGPDGDELARNDDAAQQIGDSATNAQLLNFTAPVDGTYTVRATRFFEAAGITRGTFRLSVVPGEPGAVVVLPPTQAPTAAPQATEQVVVTPAAPATDTLAVQVGDTLTGTLDDVTPAVNYTIDLQPGEVITVTLERLNGDLDPYLTVVGPSGREVAFNDDAEVPVGGIPLNAQLRGFSGDVAGTYTIQATRYGGGIGMSSGDYRLTVATGQALLAGSSLRVGDAVEGTITDALPILEYTIALDAGQTITVTLEALDGELDPYLLLLDSSGQEIAYNDDAAILVGNSAYNAQLAGWTAPATDVYTIRATRFLQATGPTTGPFRLSVTAGVSTAALPAASGITTAPDVVVGDVVTGEITPDAYAVDYPILLAAGDTIAVTMEALGGDLDTLIVIYDPQGNMASYNDDAVTQVGSDPFNSRISGFTAPSGGLYTISATRLGLDEGTTTGTFELGVTSGQPVSATDGGGLTLGDSATGGLTTTVFAIDYTVTLAAGEPVTISMIALDVTLDPTLVLYDAAGNELAYNDDAETPVGDSEFNAQILGFTPRTAGTYTIRATRFLEEGGTSVGRFRLETVAGVGNGPVQSTK